MWKIFSTSRNVSKLYNWYELRIMIYFNLHFQTTTYLFRYLEVNFYKKKNTYIYILLTHNRYCPSFVWPWMLLIKVDWNGFMCSLSWLFFKWLVFYVVKSHLFWYNNTLLYYPFWFHFDQPNLYYLGCYVCSVWILFLHWIWIKDCCNYWRCDNSEN